MHRLPALLLLALVPLTGCTESDAVDALTGDEETPEAQTADIPRIEREIRTTLSRKAGVPLTVDCPSSIEWRTGDDFRCIVTGAGESIAVTVHMENDEGDLTWVVG